MTDLINHIVLMLDASTSMEGHAASLVTVADAQIRQLAEQSKTEDQETRVTVYTFSTPPFHDGFIAKCLIYDKDVLRMPSIKGLYRPYGETALCDAVTVGIQDLLGTPVKYGNHSFLFILLTDGKENRSTPEGKRNLPGLITKLDDHWTLAAFVPDAIARRDMIRLGFPPGNVAVWDTSSDGSLTEVGEQIATASAGYMSARAAGAQSVTNLFTMAAPSAQDLKNSLTPLTRGSYFFEQVSADEYPQGAEISAFVTAKTGKPYVPGKVLYQMMKRERIQAYKMVAVQIGDDVFMGWNARAKLKLPEKGEVRVSPGAWKGYAVFIESRSFNRKLLGGTRVLILR